LGEGNQARPTVLDLRSSLEGVHGFESHLSHFQYIHEKILFEMLQEIIMKIVTIENVRSLFASLEQGNIEEFFQNVATNVEWTVMGTHPLAGTYHDRDFFIQSTFRRLDNVLKDGVRLRITNIMTADDMAIVELEALSVARNDTPFRNRYCWICRFDQGIIVEVRAYLDSALVQKLIDENEHGEL
jgi:ketosteroid isomerase-like protein